MGDLLSLYTSFMQTSAFAEQFKPNQTRSAQQYTLNVWFSNKRISANVDE